MKKFITIWLAFLALTVSVSAQKIETIYTDLSDEKCKTIESNPDEGGSYRGECPGVGGFKIELLEGDLRQSLNLVKTAGGETWELNLWSITGSGGFSSIGEKLEWRVVRKGKTVKPVALIARFYVSEDPEDSSKTTSYLLVAKIEKDTACVTDVVKPSKNQNVKARQLADKSAGKPCYTPE